MGFSKSSSNSLPFKGIIINAVKLYNPRGWKNISFLWEEELLADCIIVELLFYSTWK